MGKTDLVLDYQQNHLLEGWFNSFLHNVCPGCGVYTVQTKTEAIRKEQEKEEMF